MARYNYLYIPYIENTNINYIYLIYLYKVAESYYKDIPIYECAKSDKIKSDIDFKSFSELEQKINKTLSNYQQLDSKGNLKTLVSSSTLSRLVKNNDYKDYIDFKKFGAEYNIVLNNDFSNDTNKDRKPFVRLSPAMVSLLLEYKDNLLAKYLIYLIHSCGITNNKADFTAKQFLSAIGYSTKAGNYISQISSYNKLLSSKGIITITKWRDNNGKERNTYSVNY